MNWFKGEKKFNADFPPKHLTHHQASLTARKTCELLLGLISPIWVREQKQLKSVLRGCSALVWMGNDATRILWVHVDPRNLP